MKKKKKMTIIFPCILLQMKPVETSVWLTVPLRLQFKDHLMVSYSDAGRNVAENPMFF